MDELFAVFLIFVLILVASYLMMNINGPVELCMVFGILCLLLYINIYLY
jgi:hypothetical protein